MENNEPLQINAVDSTDELKARSTKDEVTKTPSEGRKYLEYCEAKGKSMKSYRTTRESALDEQEF